MSDDLVERLDAADLYTYNAHTAVIEYSALSEEAAAEIRSLREQVTKLEAELGYHGIYPNPIVPHDTLADSDGDDGA